MSMKEAIHTPQDDRLVTPLLMSNIYKQQLRELERYMENR
jgi:hypothetical protein